MKEALGELGEKEEGRDEPVLIHGRVYAKYGPRKRPIHCLHQDGLLDN